MNDTDGVTGARTPAGGLPRPLQIALGVVLVLAALMLLRSYSGIFGPVFLALNLMVTVYPFHTWLVRRGCPSALSAIIVALVVFVLLLLMLAGFIWAVNEIIGMIPQYTGQFVALYDRLISFASDLGLDHASLTGALGKIDPNSLLNAATSLLSASTGFLGGLSVLVCALVFMAMDTAGFARRLAIAASTHSRIVAGFRSFSQGVRSYWIVTTVFGLIVAVLDVVLLQGVRYARDVPIDVPGQLRPRPRRADPRHAPETLAGEAQCGVEPVGHRPHRGRRELRIRGKHCDLVQARGHLRERLDEARAAVLVSHAHLAFGQKLGEPRDLPLRDQPQRRAVRPDVFVLFQHLARAAFENRAAQNRLPQEARQVHNPFVGEELAQELGDRAGARLCGGPQGDDDHAFVCRA